MAQRRMFSSDIVSSDAFLDMPVSSQVLYFHLAMRSDDDGFVTPKMVMRLIGSNEDDLKVLIAKRFILPFESGVVVIKHWLIHNLIRADLYKETLYKKEKAMLGLNENGSYTELRDGVSEIKQIESPEWLKRRRGELRTANVPQTVPRLGKDRLDKDNNDDVATPSVANQEIAGIINLFKEINPSFERLFGNKTERGAVSRLLQKFGKEKLESMVKSLPSIIARKYAPRVTTPYQLEKKLGEIKAFIEQEKQGAGKNIGVIKV